MPHNAMLARGLLLACSGTVGLIATPAFAQSNAPTGAPAQLERVTVTGSNIRRTDVETAGPVQVITAAELRASGFTSTQDVLSNLTANGQGTLAQGFGGGFAEGASGISLRGLSVGATLVLIDGRRMAPYPLGDDGQRSFVDISNLPFDAIERIEILKDGASAIYGSDAIAGVVNVVLKRRFVGGVLNADLGSSGRDDGRTRSVSGIWGFGDLARDGRNVYFSAELRQQDRIRYADRAMASRDFSAQGGYDLSLGAITPFNANPASTTGYVKNGAGGGDATRYFLPGCDQAKLAAKGCTFNDTWSDVQAPTTNTNLLARLTQDLGRDWQLSASAGYFRRTLKHWSAPANTLTSGYQGVTSGPGVVPALLPVVAATSLPATNAAFPPSARGAGLGSGTLYYSFAADLGPQLIDIDSTATRLAVDLTGRLGGWAIDAAAGTSAVRLELVNTGAIDPVRLQQALNDGSFVPGQRASAAVLAGFSPTLTRADSSRLWYAHAGAGTELAWPPLFAPLSLAVGLDYVERSQHATAPAEVAAGRMTGVSNGFSIGTQQVGAAYAELVAPVTRALELTGAFRYDRYNVSGGQANPKIGFKFKPVPELLLRGTASKGFRAPGPAENGSAGLTILAGAIDDPVLCASGDPTTAGSFPTQCGINVGTIQSTTKTLKPETSTALTLGVVLEPIDRLSVSVDFYRIALRNQIVPGGSGELVRGTNLTAMPQVQADGSTLDVVPPVAPIAYTTAGYVNANATTVAGLDLGVRYKRRLAGLGDYTTELMWSYTSQYDLTIDGVTYRLAGTHGPFTVSGNTGNPRSRIQWSHTLAREDWSLTATIHHIGSFGLTDPSYVDPAGNRYDTCYRALDGNWASTIFSEEYSAGQVPKGARCKVASFTSVNLYGRYRVTKHLSLHGSITNLLNRRYPDDWNTYGQQTLAPYNPSLHAAGAIGRYFSLGASYTF